MDPRWHSTLDIKHIHILLSLSPPHSHSAHVCTKCIYLWTLSEQMHAQEMASEMITKPLGKPKTVSWVLVCVGHSSRCWESDDEPNKHGYCPQWLTFSLGKMGIGPRLQRIDQLNEKGKRCTIFSGSSILQHSLIGVSIRINCPKRSPDDHAWEMYTA